MAREKAKLDKANYVKAKWADTSHWAFYSCSLKICILQNLNVTNWGSFPPGPAIYLREHAF
jgi:hypothetical protein